MPINRESRIENLWSSVTGATPDTADFNYGEIALNVVDQKLYFKNSTGSLTVLSPSTSTVGGAVGTSTYAAFTPFYSEAPGLTYPTLDNRNTISVLDFDQTNDETTFFRGMIPQGAAFSYLQTNIYWSASGATAGTASWQVAFENIRTNPDIDSDSFDQGYTGRSYFQGTTSGLPVSIGITCENVDSLTGGDPFRLRLRRLGSDVLDTLAGDAEFLFLEVRGVT
jgi:hypothetical protein